MRSALIALILTSASQVTADLSMVETVKVTLEFSTPSSKSVDQILFCIPKVKHTFNINWL